MSSRTWTVGRSVLFMGVAFAAALLVDQLIGCMSASAQVQDRMAAGGVAANSVPPTVDDLIVRMSQSAAVIFVGHVVEIRRPHRGFAGSPEAAAEGIVEVDFSVDRAVRGPLQGSRYMLREWGGLWVGGLQRYRLGQPLLVFLRGSGSTGLSSPVHGAEGLIPLRGIGLPPGPEDNSSNTVQWMVDERWLQAQTLRRLTQIEVPGRGLVPILGSRGPHSEVPSEILPLASQNDYPLLVRALTGPWIEQPEVSIAAESLSHVLELCSNSTGVQDAAR